MSRLARPRSPDLAAACVVAALGLLISFVDPGGWPQAAALAPLVLVAPGYAIAAAVFPPGALEREDRFVCSFVFSVSAAALGGLALQVVLGLDPAVWVLLLALITAGACAVAQARRDALPIQRALDRSPPLRPPAGALWAVSLAAALAIAGGAVAVATEGVREQQSRQRFASLWALPEGSEAGIASLQLGVLNHGGPSRYVLEVSSDEQIVASQPLRLDPNELWERRIELEPAAPSPLLVTLYAGSTPYRSVELDLGAAP